jgi:hypothetical protein
MTTMMDRISQIAMLSRWIETSESLDERAALVVEKLKHNGYGEKVQEMMDREKAARHAG